LLGGNGLGAYVELELFVTSAVSVSESNSAVLANEDNLSVVGADLEEAFGFPSP
jgi:hypothetical protein